MRVALLSDVHSNLAALEAVIEAAHKAGAEAVWHMGDLVGYGPDPDAVVAVMQAEGAECVMGNHDAAALGLMPITDFNDMAKEAVLWTAARISEATRVFLSALPQTRSDGRYTCCHGTLRDPLWEYLDTYDAARAHFDAQTTLCSIVGHTHRQILLTRGESGEIEALTPEDGGVYAVAGADTATRYCINPGGAGQPRDGDPRSCYALLDTSAGSVSFHRVAYDIATTQRRIREAGLPEALAERLSIGR